MSDKNDTSFRNVSASMTLVIYKDLRKSERIERVIYKSFSINDVSLSFMKCTCPGPPVASGNFFLQVALIGRTIVILRKVPTKLVELQD